MTTAAAPIDILLATYNGAPYLPELLQSLQDQTEENWRLLVRDDGSTDATVDIIRTWAKSTGRSCVILADDGQRLGASHSFGALLAASDAPYFMFSDQDDVWLPEKIAHTWAALKKREAKCPAGTPIMAHCDLAVVSETLEPLAPSFWAQSRLDPLDPASHKRLLLENFTPGCAVMGNRALAVRALPVPDAAIMHDWWLALVAGYLGEIVTIPKPLILYRQHGGNAIGAQDWGLPGITRRFLRSPSEAISRTKRILRRTPAQAQAFADRFVADLKTSDAQNVEELAALPKSALLRRKTYFLRSGMRPSSWLRTCVLWVFI